MEDLMGLLNDRTATVALGVIGMAICSAGVGKVAESGNWVSVPGVLGSMIGVVALAILGAAIAGKELPGLPGDRAALVVLGTILIMKIGIASVFKLAA